MLMPASSVHPLGRSHPPPGLIRRRALLRTGTFERVARREDLGASVMCGSLPAQQRLCRCHYLARLEPKPLLQFLKRRGGPKRFHAIEPTRLADVTLPSETRSLFYGNTGVYVRWQDGILIGLRLMIEYFPGWNRNHSRADAFSDQRFVGLHSETDFTARGDQDDLRISFRAIGKNISAACNPRGGSILGPIECRQRLTRESQYGWLMSQLHNVAIGLDDFVGVGRPQCD